MTGVAPDDKAVRASSFGGVAEHYERFRPGPPQVAVDWYVPTRVARIVDLGAGTGGLTRSLIDKADEVVAVEPDDRMRAVLAAQLPSVRALAGRGESIPLPDRCVDAVLASASWHWMDPIPTLQEVARVLVPGGVLGALWAGPDNDGPFMSQARAMLAGRRDDTAAESGELANVLDPGQGPSFGLEIPSSDLPFEPPEQEVFRWDVALNADELIGLLGTLSWVILMPDDKRAALFDEARRLLRDLLGVEGDVTVDVQFRADCFRTRYTG
jgi:SAM-dependent methyltransferase